MTNNKKEKKTEEELLDLQKKLRVKLDQIMKNLFSVSSPVLIDMLNSLFEEDYDPENTEIVLTNNEFVLEYDDYDTIRGDVFFRLQDRQGKPYQYHIDFQTIYDEDMIIRLFAYGFSKAREIARLDRSRGETTIYIPRQLVMYIEEHKDITDQLKLRIVYPDGDEKKYSIPVMKYWEYNTSDLLENKLYPLLPLQVFKLRRRLNLLKKREHTPLQLQEILQESREIAEEVGCVSRRLYDKKIITGEDLHGILTALGNLVRYLHSKYGYIQCIIKEVEKMLKTLYDPVVEERGRKEGKKEGKKEVALAALKEGYTLDSIMRITGLDENTILKLDKEEAMDDNQNMSIDTDNEGVE